MGSGFNTWIQGLMGWDQKQNEQIPYQIPAIEEESLNLPIPQLCTEYNLYGMEYIIGQFRITCPVSFSPQAHPFTFCTLQCTPV